MEERGTLPLFGPREWLVTGALALAFVPAVLSLAEVWSRVDYQSHGFLVPVVALWAALRMRPRFRRLQAEPDARGLAVLALAVLAYLGGLLAGLVSLQGVALVAAVAGCLLYLRGAAWLRAAAFPIGFLLFMVPVPPGWITPFILKLQGLVSALSIETAGWLGIAVLREGNVLTLASGEALFVAEACSGVTSIITLTPLAVLLAYFTLKRFSSQLTLVVAVIPLAVAGNLARVVGTLAVADRFGAARATQGPPHDLLGMLTYLVACGLMLAVGSALRRLEAR